MSKPEAHLTAAGRDARGRSAESDRDRDAEIVEWVRAAGPNSAELEYLLSVLLPGVIAMFKRMDRRGGLLPAVMDCVGTRLPAPAVDWPDKVDDLICLAVTESKPGFVSNTLFGDQDRRWRPDGGASLRTYFARQCMFKFKDLYLAQCRDRGGVEIPIGSIRGDEASSDKITIRIPLHQRPADNPQTLVEDRDEIRCIFAGVSDQMVEMIWEKAQGKTYEEIGEARDMSKEEVRNMFRSLRRRNAC